MSDESLVMVNIHTLGNEINRSAITTDSINCFNENIYYPAAMIASHDISYKDVYRPNTNDCDYQFLKSISQTETVEEVARHNGKTVYQIGSRIIGTFNKEVIQTITYSGGHINSKKSQQVGDKLYFIDNYNNLSVLSLTQILTKGNAPQTGYIKTLVQGVSCFAVSDDGTVYHTNVGGRGTTLYMNDCMLVKIDIFDVYADMRRKQLLCFATTTHDIQVAGPYVVVLANSCASMQMSNHLSVYDSKSGALLGSIHGSSLKYRGPIESNKAMVEAETFKLHIYNNEAFIVVKSESSILLVKVSCDGLKIVKTCNVEGFKCFSLNTPVMRQ